ncbi:hypothetical protein AD006_30865 (plasmid) [Pseudonocardia sp. EC080610-09]|uniref:LuxR C-terminal-related transcriptional regulator n=1 Tax=unclassified Pseudonocardia TaxID=2619320 RepID=UPI0007065606|nr:MULTISPECIES: response regulator transcription factor [unclassified Pseudonocardia]ALL79605.1 hypothetical protein AD006_30865 [Pseudonocardia sp. EC080610-09]ALL85440.1 hypothetical protein AD017_30370 [Pseudonocardia sp. EC080619-01]
MSDPGGPATVLIVDDHPVVVDGVGALLEATADLRVAGWASDRATAITEAGRLCPTVVLLDLRMQGTYAPGMPARITSVAPGTRVLLHTATEELEPVRAALAGGADGVVFKDSRLLVEALRAVVAGQIPYVDARLLARERGPEGGRPASQVLSPREYELLCAVATGQSTREIAQALFLTESTVRSYLKSLFVKLGVHSRIEALAEARRQSLI